MGSHRPTPVQAAYKDDFKPAREDVSIGPAVIDLNILEPCQCQDLYIILHLAVGIETEYGITNVGTDQDGVITFPNLALGSYFLREVSDYEMTTPRFDATGLMTTPINVSSSEVVLITAGNIMTVAEAPVVIELPADHAGRDLP